MNPIIFANSKLSKLYNKKYFTIKAKRGFFPKTLLYLILIIFSPTVTSNMKIGITMQLPKPKKNEIGKSSAYSVRPMVLNNKETTMMTDRYINMSITFATILLRNNNFVFF